MGETPASTYTATYGHFPLTYSGLSPYFYSGLHPYSGLGWPYTYPLVTVAKPAEEEAAVEAARKKRSADPEAEPEAEADPQLLLTSGLHYPAAVTTYASPAPIKYTLPTTYTLPTAYSGLYSGLHHPFGYHPLLTVAKPAEEEAAVEAARKKRSADPEAEADPQLLLSTGLHGLHTPYTYPLTYSSPLAYSAITPIHRPITYTYPLGTSYGYHLGGYP